MNREINLTTFLNPFSSDHTAMPVSVIGNIVDTIDASGLHFPSGINCTILLNGITIPREEWEFTFPKPGDSITLKLIPQGGSGKNVMRIVMTIALISTVWGTPTALGGWGGVGASLFSSGSAAFGVNAALTYAGLLLIDKIAPLPTPSTTRQKEDAPKTYGIESSTNRMNPWGAVPVLLGRHRFHPPYAAQPYTEYIGDEQYINMLFCLGYAPIQIEDMKLGAINIDDYAEEGFTNNDYTAHETDRNIEFYVHDNFDSNNSQLVYFKNDMHEEQFSYELVAANNYIIATTEPNTDEFIVDITAPNGVYGVTDNGTKTQQTVEFEIQFSPHNNNNWSLSSEGTSISQATFTIAKPSNSHMEYLDTDGAVVRTESVGYKYTRIGLDKTNGAWYITPYYNNSIYPLYPARSAALARQATPHFPGYVAPVCGITTASTDASIAANNLADLRTAELSSNNANDFTPSVSAFNVTVSSGILSLEPRIISASSATIRRSFRFRMNNAGTWDVRVRRITEDHDPVDDRIYDTIYWTGLKSINHNCAAVDKDGLVLVEMRVRASEQFNGAMEDFTVLATSVCKDWDTSSKTWIERPTSNPASLFRHILQGTFNKRPVADAKLNLTDLATWHEYCDGMAVAFNLYCDYQTSVFEMLANVAAAGRSSPTYKDGKYTIVTDKEQTTPVQHFTPRTSWGFSSTKTFYTPPHAFRVTFADGQQDFATEEAFVYDDGYNLDGSNNCTKATLFEELKLIGATTYHDVWKHGRFHLAQLRLRPETFTINTDIENLACTRGDLVRVTHDIPMWGLATGRIKTVATSGNNITGITVDEECSMNNNNNYAVRIRLSTGNSSYHPITTVEGNQTSLNFTTPVAANNNNIASGDLFQFGVANDESVECIVKAIRPLDNLSAEIDLMDYSAAVYTSDNNAIPAYDTHITAAANDISPVIDSVRSDERVMIKRGTVWSPRILVSFKPRAADRLSDILFVEGQFKPSFSTAAWVSIGHFSKDVSSVFIDNVEQGVEYWLRFRYLYRDRHNGPWCATYTHTVVGKSGNPSDASFDDPNCEFTSNRIKFAILPISDFDLDFYEIRTDTDFGDDDGLIVRTKSPIYIYSGILAINQTYYLKACDTSGNYSTNYDSITAPSADTFAMGTVTVEFSTIDCVLTWAALDSKKLDYYQVAAYNNSSMNATTELIYTSEQFVNPHFIFDFWTNNNCTGGPYRAVWFRVTAHDIYGRSCYADAYGLNPEPPKITDCSAAAGLQSLTIGCGPLFDDIVGYQFACDVDNPPTNNQEVGTNFAYFGNLTPGANYYYRARAKDPFGYSNNWSDVANATPQSLNVTPQDMDIPYTIGANWEAANGIITWSNHTLIYQGQSYNIEAGNAGNNLFVYWNAASNNNVYNTADAMPANFALWMLCYRRNNNAFPAVQSPIIHGGLIQTNTIHGTKIVAGTLYVSNIVGSKGALNFTSDGCLNFNAANGSFNISAGNVNISTASGMNLSSANGIRVQAGSGIFVAGNATTPGKVQIYRSGLTGNYMFLGANGSEFMIHPSANGVETLRLGNSTNNRWSNFYSYTSNETYMYSYNYLCLQARGGSLLELRNNNTCNLAGMSGIELHGNKHVNSITNIGAMLYGTFTANNSNNRIISTSGRTPQAAFLCRTGSNGAATHAYICVFRFAGDGNNSVCLHLTSGAYLKHGYIGREGYNLIVSRGADGSGPNGGTGNVEYFVLY